MLDFLGDIVMWPSIAGAIGYIARLVFKYFSKEQNLVYNLESRDLGIREDEATLRRDYLRDKMLEGKLALPEPEFDLKSDSRRHMRKMGK